MDGHTTVSRRSALGLGMLEIIGASAAGAVLLRGDAPAGGVASGRMVSDRPLPGRVASRRVASRRVASGPVASSVTERRSPVRPARGHAAARALPGPPAAERLVPVAVRHAPAMKVHDILPGAPPHTIALTIDDGPSREWTPKVLDLLAQHRVIATFCLIGEEVRAHPALVREIVAAGHQVANHTMHHPLDLARMRARGIEAEIADAQRRIQDISGCSPRLFRSPGGSWSKAVLSAVARHGMLPIDWDIDPRDWSRPGIDHITRTLLRGRAGDILLCHDGGGDRSQTLRSLRDVIPALQDRGLEFITL